MTAPTLSEARANRDAAKYRLHSTASRTGQKLSPRSIAQDAVDGARDRALAVAGEATDQVRRRPAMVAAGLTFIAAFLARRRLVRWRSSKRTDATAFADSYPDKRGTSPAKGPTP